MNFVAELEFESRPSYSNNVTTIPRRVLLQYSNYSSLVRWASDIIQILHNETKAEGLIKGYLVRLWLRDLNQ